MKWKLSLSVTYLLLAPARAALQQISNWGTNTGSLTLHAYVPSNVASSPAVILAVSIVHMVPDPR